MHPPDSPATARLTIRVDHVRENIALLRGHLPPDTRIMVMLKASAYGTDDYWMSHFLKSCDIDIIGVAHAQEGIRLRQAGVTQSIFVTAAPPQYAPQIVAWDLEVGVSDQSLLEALNREGRKAHREVKVHLNIDTGMGRLGCPPGQQLAIAQRISDLPFLEFEGVMSHFAGAESPLLDPRTQTQIALFDEALHRLASRKLYPRWRHLANSSGALRFSLPQCNMVRVGLAIYGVHLSKETAGVLPLRPALSFSTEIMALQKLPAHSTVGYGYGHTLLRDSLIAVLPVGYFDGLHRQHSEKHRVSIRGHLAPMIGTICMDHLMVDVTKLPRVRIGDEATFFGCTPKGHHTSLEEFAAEANTIPHEVMACLGPRVQRVFLSSRKTTLEGRFAKFRTSNYAATLTS